MTATTTATSTVPEMLNDLHLPLPDRRDGKVRISWELDDDRRLFVTTDRLSAFDRVLGCVPDKGQVLNRLAWWWFGELADIVPNHAVSLPHPNVLVARSLEPLSVEVIVRGAITGVTDTSLWRRYQHGARIIDGHTLPDGLRKNEFLPTAIITPTTKAAAGGHDSPLSVADVATQGLVPRRAWSEVCDAALALFERGQQIASSAGLVLADTKYEFGLDAHGDVMLIDEVHTPDSSRYWEGATYEDCLGRGEEPQSLDKEIIRRAYADLGYRGDGDVPTLPSSTWNAVADGYRTAFERITGSTIERATGPISDDIVSSLTKAGLLKDGV